MEASEWPDASSSLCDISSLGSLAAGEQLEDRTSAEAMLSAVVDEADNRDKLRSDVVWRCGVDASKLAPISFAEAEEALDDFWDAFRLEFGSDKGILAQQR